MWQIRCSSPAICNCCVCCQESFGCEFPAVVMCTSRTYREFFHNPASRRVALMLSLVNIPHTDQPIPQPSLSGSCRPARRGARLSELERFSQMAAEWRLSCWLFKWLLRTIISLLPHICSVIIGPLPSHFRGANNRQWTSDLTWSVHAEGTERSCD